MKGSNKPFWYVMDNASVHHSNLTTCILKDLDLNVMFLPAYSPELEPVEKFLRLTKNKIRVQWQIKNTHSIIQKKEL